MKRKTNLKEELYSRRNLLVCALVRVDEQLKAIDTLLELFFPEDNKKVGSAGQPERGALIGPLARDDQSGPTLTFEI